MAVKRVRAKTYTPSSDKEICSVFLVNLLKNVEVDYDELREIAGKNLRDTRLEKIEDRIKERLEKILVPVEKYLATKQ